MKELRLKISGFVISIVSSREDIALKTSSAHRYFITNEQPATVIRVHYGGFPKLDLEEDVFDSGATWRLFTSNGKYVFKIPFRMAVIDQDFKYGDIYFKSSLSLTARHYPLQYPLDELLMINILSKGRGTIFHACGINDKGQGILFIGVSGAGKSTLANLWKNKGNVILLSDDRIITRKIDGRFFIYGTPWHGDANICSPERAPLKKIFFLKHAKTNKVERIEGINAASKLLVCSFPTFWDKKGMEFTLGFIDEIIREIPCYELEFVPNKTAIDFVKNI